MGDAVLDLLYLLSLVQLELLFTLQFRSFELIHSTVIKCLNYNDVFIGDRLVSLYTRLGCIKDAHNLFDEIPHKDLVSWNSIISSFSQKGDVSLSLNAFYRLRQEDGMNPNEITLMSLISACGTVEGGYIHGFAVKNGLISEIKVLNSLINMYGKFGFSNEASGLFEMIKLPNLVSWNSIIKIYIQSGLLEKSIMYFNLMRRAGISPDQATIVTILQSCGDLGVGKVVDAFHGLILCSGLDKSIPTTTALLSVYAKSGRLTASCEVFREMKDRDMIAWTAMLAGYAMHGLDGVLGRLEFNFGELGCYYCCLFILVGKYLCYHDDDLGSFVEDTVVKEDNLSLQVQIQGRDTEVHDTADRGHQLCVFGNSKIHHLLLTCYSRICLIISYDTARDADAHKIFLLCIEVKMVEGTKLGGVNCSISLKLMNHFVQLCKKRRKHRASV
ncbi:hypothetical protein L6452_08164 [Arctium lappa]|uniref:Uncharacterized protein n=1 Tax=Arctium lappa TaxID=4217 RepID=A0ACB9DGT9_ARCLA|nr:hypothetical protein L6452_08164 [Arctium lappa]